MMASAFFSAISMPALLALVETVLKGSPFDLRQIDGRRGIGLEQPVEQPMLPACAAAIRGSANCGRIVPVSDRGPIQRLSDRQRLDP